MCASHWISTHRMGCGVSTLCVCVCVRCMYACITLDLYTPYGMWCEYTVCVCVRYMYVCITLTLYTPYGMWCKHTVRVCMSGACMRASHWISTHRMGCGVSTLCVCVCVRCVYAWISPDLLHFAQL